MYHLAAKAMTKLTSHSCGDVQLAVCLSRQDGAIYVKTTQTLMNVWQATETSLRNKP